MGPGKLTLDATQELGCQILSAELVPNHSDSERKQRLCDATKPAPELETTWTIEGDLGQDWESQAGAVEYLRANNGIRSPVRVRAEQQ